MSKNTHPRNTEELKRSALLKKNLSQHGYILEVIALRWIQAVFGNCKFLGCNKGVVMAVLDQVQDNGLENDAIESVIHENLEEQLAEAKYYLERAFSGQVLSDAVLGGLEEAIKPVRKPVEGRNKLLNLSERLQTAALKVEEISKNYEKCLSDEVIQSLTSYSQGLRAWAETSMTIHCMPRNLSPQLSKNSIRKWLNCMRTLADIVERYNSKFPPEQTNILEVVAQYSLRVCQAPGWSGSLKEKYRKEIMYVAGFLIHQLSSYRNLPKTNIKENNQSSWKLVLGQKPYSQILKESQKNIHLIDQLYSGEEEEAREQAETLEYIQRELKKD